MADFSDQVYGAGGDDDAIGWGDGPSLFEGGGQIGGCLSRDVQGAGCSLQIFEAGCARVVDGGEEDLVVEACGVSGGGVEEREKDLGHLFEVLVAEAGEEEGSGLGFGELGDGGAERPGAGGVVSYV